jgi:hypothetical protein
MSPSWLFERAPPGKTCAEAKLEAFLTRWSRRIWFEGEIRRTLELFSMCSRFLRMRIVFSSWETTM